MPIKPENRKRYPADWKAIRARILARAGNRCEKCNAPNRRRIARGAGKDEGTYMLASAEVFCHDTGELLGTCRRSDYELSHMVEVVLTIAHLDHVPENCAEENLRAWCQRCHLRYDTEHRKQTAYATRKAAANTMDLPLFCTASTGADTERRRSNEQKDVPAVLSAAPLKGKSNA
jgi:hypothetical protein